MQVNLILWLSDPLTYPLLWVEIYSPQIHVEALISGTVFGDKASNVTIFGDGASNEIIKLN